MYGQPRLHFVRGLNAARIETGNKDLGDRYCRMLNVVSLTVSRFDTIHSSERQSTSVQRARKLNLRCCEQAIRHTSHTV